MSLWWWSIYTLENQTNTGSCSVHKQPHARPLEEKGEWKIKEGSLVLSPQQHWLIFFRWSSCQAAWPLQANALRGERGGRGKGGHKGKSKRWKARRQRGQRQRMRRGRGGEGDETEKPWYKEKERYFLWWFWAIVGKVQASVRIWLHASRVVLQTRGVSPFSPLEINDVWSQVVQDFLYHWC